MKILMDIHHRNGLADSIGTYVGNLHISKRYIYKGTFAIIKSLFCMKLIGFGAITFAKSEYGYEKCPYAFIG